MADCESKCGMAARLAERGLPLTSDGQIADVQTTRTAGESMQILQTARTLTPGGGQGAAAGQAHMTVRNQDSVRGDGARKLTAR